MQIMLLQIDSGKICFNRVKLSESKSQHLSVKCATAVTPKVVDAWIAYVKKLFQESGLIKCGHVSKISATGRGTGFFISDTSEKVLAKEAAMKKMHKTGGERWAGANYCFWCWIGIWCDASFIHCLQMQASI